MIRDAAVNQKPYLAAQLGDYLSKFEPPASYLDFEAMISPSPFTKKRGLVEVKPYFPLSTLPIERNLCGQKSWRFLYEKVAIWIPTDQSVRRALRLATFIHPAVWRPQLLHSGLPYCSKRYCSTLGPLCSGLLDLDHDQGDAQG
jgi:hypothetical protein